MCNVSLYSSNFYAVFLSADEHILVSSIPDLGRVGARRCAQSNCFLLFSSQFQYYQFRQASQSISDLGRVAASRSAQSNCFLLFQQILVFLVQTSLSKYSRLREGSGWSKCMRPFWGVGSVGPGCASNSSARAQARIHFGQVGNKNLRLAFLLRLKSSKLACAAISAELRR